MPHEKELAIYRVSTVDGSLVDKRTIEDRIDIAWSAKMEDLNGDGLGDNKYPLTLLDKIKLNSNLIIPVFIVILTTVGIISVLLTRKTNISEKYIHNDDKYADFDIEIQPDLTNELNSDNSEIYVKDNYSDSVLNDEIKLEKFDEYPGWLWDPSKEEWIPED